MRPGLVAPPALPPVICSVLSDLVIQICFLRSATPLLPKEFVCEGVGGWSFAGVLSIFRPFGGILSVATFICDPLGGGGSPHLIFSGGKYYLTASLTSNIIKSDIK